MVKCKFKFKCILTARRAWETCHFPGHTLWDSPVAPGGVPGICRFDNPSLYLLQMVQTKVLLPDIGISGTLTLNPVCVISVSAAWGPGPQSCQLSPAGLLGRQHLPSTGLPLGE